jgi:hypothetical protein
MTTSKYLKDKQGLKGIFKVFGRWIRFIVELFFISVLQ